MKVKLLLTIISLVIFLPSLFSQDANVPMYVKLYGAYGFFSPGSFKGEPAKPLSSDTSFFKVGKKGMGEGIRVGAGFGFILSDYVNVGIDGEYLIGSTIEIPVNQSYSGTAGTKETSSTVNSLTTINHTILSIIPNVTFKAVSKPSYHVYTRLGIVVGIPLDVTQEYMSTYRYVVLPHFPFEPAYTLVTTYHAEYELKVSIGYQAALGLQFKISDKFRVFGEISGYRLSLNLVKYEETERVKKEVPTGPAAPLTPPDLSRNIILYKTEGSKSVERQGTVDDYVYVYTQPQEPLNINAITVVGGIFYRF